MNNKYAVISYVNYELKVLVYNVYAKSESKYAVAKTPLLLYEKSLGKINFEELGNDIERGRIVASLSSYLDNAKKIVKAQNLDVVVVFDPERYHYTFKNFEIDFAQEHVITESDLTKVMNAAMYDKRAEEGFKIVNFIPHEIKVGGKKVVKNPLGIETTSLSVTGEVLSADTGSYYALTSVLSKLNVNITGYFIGSNIIKNNFNLQPDNGLIEVGVRSIDFTFNLGEQVKQTKLEIGFEDILNELYTELANHFPAEDSERAVRFIMQHFALKPYDTDLTVAGDIKLDDLIDYFRRLIAQYFKEIFDRLKTQNIEVNNYTVLLHDYPMGEFVELLNETLDQTFTEQNLLKKSDIDVGNIKQYYLVKMLATNDIQQINRGIHG